MKKLLHTFHQLPLVVLMLSLLTHFSSFSQCTDTSNIGFQSCDFTCWTGTYCIGDIVSTYPDPFKYTSLSIGTVNQAPNKTPEKNHFIMNSGNKKCQR